MQLTASLAEQVGVKRACSALAVPKASFYRWQQSDSASATDIQRPRPPLALSDDEVAEILSLLNSDQFVDSAPLAVYNALLDEGRYLCSASTMYRVLRKNDEVKERRNQVRRSNYEKPELLAKGPNQVWSWDITKIKGPQKGTCYYLYVIIDVYSRYVVGWMLATRETGALAKKLIQETCEKQGVQPDKITLHSDRGSIMKCNAVAALLIDLGIFRSLSRPHVSDDNPYSEAQFKTLKYRPGYPERFASFEEALAFFQGLFAWYNKVHYHSGIANLTPEDVHHGRAEQVIQKRQAVLDDACARHPARFKGKKPKHPELPKAAWINKPAADVVAADAIA